MRFESGMAGFLIVVLAVSGAIFGTIILNSSETTQEVTKYDFKTEVTGLFPVDTSPEFYDYDLARNYTGYFTLDTQVNGVNYFGGATFRETGVNNYPVKFKPVTQGITGNYNLNDYTLTMSDPPKPSLPHITLGFFDNTGYYSYAEAQSVTLSSVIQALNLNQYDVIEITPISDAYADNIYLNITDRYYHAGGDVYQCNIHLRPDAENLNPDTSTGLIPWFSCKVDNVTGQTNVYSSKTISQANFKGSFSTSDVVLNYLLDGDSAGTNGAIIGKSIKVTAYNTGEVQYMDISQGVMVTGVTE